MRSNPTRRHRQPQVLVLASASWVASAALVASGGLGGCSSAHSDTPSSDASTVSDVTRGDETPSVLEGGGADAGASDGAADVAVSAPSCPSDGGIPDDLACTGLYADWASKAIASDVMPYTPGVVFWSDGAEKQRWLYLPPAPAKIDTTDMDSWVFPVGTKIWKQFALSVQIIETRLIWKTSDAASGWTYLDYRWSADGTSAKRLDAGEKNVGGTTYEIPRTADCANCHAGRPDVVLGVDFVGLGVSGAQGVTLASLAAQDRFTQPPPTTAVRIPEDATGKAAAALGWLHVNCGTACHNATTGAQANYTQLWLKLLAGQMSAADGGTAPVAQLDSYTSTVGVLAHKVFNGVDYPRIAAGDAAGSLVALMAAARGDDAAVEAMPPIVSHIPDTAGLALVSAWIDALGDGGTAGDP
jgi:hypothetical protein